MHVIIAPDCYTGIAHRRPGRRRDRRGLGPHRAATTCSRASRSPTAGPASSTCSPPTCAARCTPSSTTDPLGREVPATLLLVDGEGGPTAYLESAQAAGLHLLAPDERDPTRTTTLGVGTLLLAALDAGARRIVIGLGGSGTNDAGAGLLAALGVGPVDRLARGGLALAEVTEADLPGLDAARDRLRGIDLVIASDVDSPAAGPQGRERRLRPAEGRLGGGRPASRERPRPLRERRRAGPAAGQGPALGHPAQARAPAGRRRRGRSRLRPAPARSAPGLRCRCRARRGRLRPLLATADLVVTGEGRFDWQSLRGKVVVGVAEAAGRPRHPGIAIPGPVAGRPARGHDGRALRRVCRRRAPAAGGGRARRPRRHARAARVGARSPGRWVARVRPPRAARRRRHGCARSDRGLRRILKAPGTHPAAAWVVTPDPRSTT